MSRHAKGAGRRARIASTLARQGLTTDHRRRLESGSVMTLDDDDEESFESLAVLAAQLQLVHPVAYLVLLELSRADTPCLSGIPARFVDVLDDLVTVTSRPHGDCVVISPRGLRLTSGFSPGSVNSLPETGTR